MATTPPPSGSWEPADDHDKDRPSPHPADKDNDKPRGNEAERRRKIEWRSQLRYHIENPAYFVAQPDELPANLAEIESRIFPLSGERYIAVRRDWAKKPLQDPEARIGVCDVHPLPATVPTEENPCAYQCVCYFIATSPTELRRALFEELLIGSPDMSRGEVWKSIDEEWCIVEVEVEAVRCAWLFDDPALAGGEPQLRHDGQLLASRDASSWRRVREMLDQDAALVVLGGDPEGTGEAQRIVIFTVPGLALEEVNALKWREPKAFSEFEGWGGFGHSARPRTSSLPNRQSLIRRKRSELKFRYRMWRANCRAARDERRERRDQRRRASAERWQVRQVIFEALRELIAVVREGAEALIMVTKAILLGILMVGAPPALVITAIRLLKNLS